MRWKVKTLLVGPSPTSPMRRRLPTPLFSTISKAVSELVDCSKIDVRLFIVCVSSTLCIVASFPPRSPVP